MRTMHAVESQALEQRYLAYGMVFESALALPELPLAPSSIDGPGADVRIQFGEVPESLNDPVSSGIVYQASENQFLLNMQGIARYLVRNGDEIIVQPADGAEESDVRVFMLGTAFGALLHQRQMLVMHAGAVHTDKGAVLFSGPSGVGKSTLLGELLRRGYPMIVDDVCGVVLREGADGTSVPTVLPGYPRTQLWADAARKLKIDTEGLPRTRRKLEKFERQLSDQFYAESSNLHKIFILSSRGEEDIEVVALPTIRCFGAILHNTYRNAFLDGLAMRRPHFDLTSAVAARVTIKRVCRPATGFKLGELADAIEQDLSGEQ